MQKFLLDKYKRILVTGGSGFIGSNLLKRLFKEENLHIFNLDKLSYSSDKFFGNSKEKDTYIKYNFLKVDLNNEIDTRNALEISKPDLIIHLAAESHVDRSIDSPKIFLESNTIGTFNLLEASRQYWNNLNLNKKNLFKFIHVSTDEVFGSLSSSGKFKENSQYEPSSPYSASKAASDHFVRSWYKTFKFPSIISNCSNNYGPRQFPEKLIPLTIQKIINKSIIPIFGNGSNIRDWLFVDDHIEALLLIANNGSSGSRYCIGGGEEITNVNLIKLICEKIDKKFDSFSNSDRLIKFVKDRPGHDFRYSIDNSFIKEELKWQPKTTLNKGLDKTIDWYFNNLKWCREMINDSKYNLNRLGTKI